MGVTPEQPGADAQQQLLRRIDARLEQLVRQGERSRPAFSWQQACCLGAAVFGAAMALGLLCANGQVTPGDPNPYIDEETRQLLYRENRANAFYFALTLLAGSCLAIGCVVTQLMTVLKK